MRKATARPLPASAERHQRLWEWNDTERRYPQAGLDLHRLWASWSARTPESTAVVSEDRWLSYGELARRAGLLAAELAARRVGPEVPVAIFMERSPELVIAALAVLEAGGVYVPLDPSNPPRRLAFLLADTGPALILTQERLRRDLPEHPAEVLCLDAGGGIRHRPGTPAAARRAPGAAPENAAYVLYTSGSTGRPKGVVVPHRAIVNRLLWGREFFALGRDERFLLTTPLGFDVSVLELFSALANGGLLVIARPGDHLDHAYQRRLIAEQRITHLESVPSLFGVFLDEPDLERCGATVRRASVGGEELTAGLARRFFERFQCVLHHAYGPTEAAVDAVAWICRPGRIERVVPIGRPIANLTVHPLTPDLEPAPAGEPGELAIGGVGLARGYLGRPGRTAAAFVPDPFARRPGARLYRSGDLARRRPDGALEFAGRIDHQVKVRGVRIEPGEVEAALGEHPKVYASAVVARPQGDGANALVAYVVRDRRRPEAAAAEAGMPDHGMPDHGVPDREEHVDAWQASFDEVYRRVPAGGDPTFNTVGWDSTYDGEPLPEAEMRQWLEDTLERIRGLAPRRVLEIGCGTGMLLHRLAPGCRRYVGTDISAAALADLEHQLAERDLPQVELLERPADRFDGLEAGSFDTVILNSVVQYFPDRAYLEEVLGRAVAAVAPAGAVFVGDVRSLPLLEAFHAAVALHRAPPELPADELWRQARTHSRLETELVLDPRFFLQLGRRLPAVTRVGIHPKRGSARNELTRFRYQVVLWVGGDRAPEPEIRWRDWRQQGLTLERVRSMLEGESTPGESTPGESTPGADGGPPAVLALHNIPNARLARSVEAVRRLRAGSAATAGELRRQLAAADLPGVDPEDLATLAAGRSYDLETGWFRPGVDGAFEAVFRRRSAAGRAGGRPAAMPAPPPVEELESAALANDPLSGRFAARVVPELRRFLGERLPGHMLPAAFVVLDDLPLAASGKLDRRALPAPELGRGAGVPVAPRSTLERRLAAIWAEVLGVRGLGVDDDFFALGGHSLAATRVVSRLRRMLGLEVPLRAFFRAPTVALLAAHLEVAGAAGEVLPLRPVERRGPIPLSFAQERLWFLDRLDPGSAAYNVPYLIAIDGELSPGALEAAWSAVLRRHEALCTVFADHGEGPVQVIAPAHPCRLPVVELGALATAAARRTAARLCRREARRPFDLARGPLARPLLLRLDRHRSRLLVTLHHIVTDGWSLEVLLRELVALYRSAAAGRPSPLAPLPIQYPDFALWQRNWLAGDVLAGQLDYWRGRLAGAPEGLELATDRPRPKRPRGLGGGVEQRWPAALGRRLDELAERRGATRFMVALAAFQALLHRTTGEDDLVVGSPVSNRHRVEIEGLIGFFANTLVLRGDLAGDPAFEDLLARVAETTLGAYDHQDLPFERLVEELRPRRELARNPLFQVMFQLREPAPPPPATPGLELRPRQLENGAAKFDLNLFLESGAEGLEAHLEYSAELFDPATARRFLGHYRTLLTAALEAPRRRLSELPLLTPAERHQLAVEWAAVDPAAGAAPPLQRRVEEQARRTPEAVAVVLGDARVSYRELDRRADFVAGQLRRRGVGPETAVGLAAERSPALIVALLGILKAGGVCVPLDPELPARRLRFLRRDSAAAVVVADARGAAALGDETGVARLTAAGRLAGGSQVSAPATSSPSSPAGENLAWLIYTSGSTGRPKGVMLRHRSICRRLLFTAEAYPLDAADRVLQTASLSFDFAIWECFAPLVVGAQVVLARPGGQGDADYLVRAIAEQRVTVVHFVPSMLRVFLAAAGIESCRSLRWVLAGGEALPRELQERLAERLATTLRNQYGPTEATIDTADWTCRPGGAAQTSVPIGRAPAYASLRVLDRRLRTLPTGVAGELCVSGEGLARGYLRRPGLTAERFVPDPFAERPGERLYRTGDRARHLATGVLDFLGRLDRQVKIRGYRIEPGEIEARLDAHPALSEACVEVREHQGDSRLVAYVVPAGDARPVPGELRSYLAARLPGYMIPAAFVARLALPRTAGGKLDRVALGRTRFPQPVGEGTLARRRPQTPDEELLGGIFAEVLGRSRVAADDDFFALGGHSLLAARVISRLRLVLGVEIPLSALFERPTVAALARRLRSARRAGRPLPALEPVARDGPLPLSFAQERLWFLHQLEPRDASYNVAEVLELSGLLSPPALAAALDEIRRRHETLRTTFPELDGEPRQAIGPPQAVPLAVIDLADLPSSSRRRELDRLLDREARRPFDLARGPLLRCALVRRARDRHLLLLFMHHIVTDAWSMTVLVEELAELYRASLAGEPSPLPALPVQYADHALGQRRWLTGGSGRVLAGELDDWRRQLEGAPESLELPTDRPRPASWSSRGAELATALPEELRQRLAALARRRGATLFMTLLAAFETLLQRTTGEDDVVVGSPISNRNRLEIEGLIGFFTNTVVLRVDLGGDPTFEQLLARTAATARAAYDRQELPFERLVEALRPRRDLSRHPLFQVLFVVDSPQPPPSLPGVEVRRAEAATGTAKFDLSVFVVPERGSETDAGLELAAEYATDLFDRTTIERLLGHYRQLLAGVAAAPERRLSELPLLTPGERHQLLAEWADSRRAAPAAPVHRLFEEVARRAPEAVAVALAGESLTYGELERRSRALARRLRRLGVGPEVAVALAVDRTPALAVAVLGVLRAGGACLPLDPSWPRRRLGFMAEDSRSPVLVSDGHPELAAPGTAVVELRSAAADPVPRLATAPDAAPGAGVEAENLAYVLYTSGSTGRPKGVAMRHRALANLIAWQLGAAAVGEGGRTLQFAALSFDVSFQELFATWGAGGTLVLVPPEVRSDRAALGRYLERLRVERLFLPFIALQQLAEWSSEVGGASPRRASPRRASPRRASPRRVRLSLREVVTAGEALQVTSAVKELFARSPGCVLENQYGPTESHVVTAHRLQGRAASWPTLPPIGRGIKNLEIRLVDRRLRPVAVGVSGELLIGGAGLARGYLARAGRTAESFVPDPWSGRCGARLYRTGDLARWGPGGEIAFLGRIDQQVKVRGHRVEPGEIEAALVAHPGVEAAAVVVRQLAPGDRALVAWWVAAGGGADAGALRSHLGGRLPEHMVPAVFVELAELPRTASGKLDRRRLPAPEAGSRAAAPYAAPRTPTQELLAGIWSAVLGLERVGVEDDFFALGGHSLLATRLVSRVREVFAVELPVSEIFRVPILAEQAAAIAALQQQASGQVLPPLEAVPRQGLLELSFAQQRLWFIARLEPDSAEYNLPMALRLDGAVEAALLERSFAALVERHEVLRTRFVEDGGEAAQIIDPAGAFFLPQVDLRRLPAPQRDGELLRLAAADARRPFDLARGPLLRATLLALALDQHVLLLNQHHIVSDGWSLGTLIRELGALYRAASDRVASDRAASDRAASGRTDGGEAAILPRLPVQYADYAVWQRRWFRGEVRDRQLAYWRRQLAAAPMVLELPADRPRPAVRSTRGAVRPLRLPASLGGELEVLSRGSGATLFMTLMAGFEALLGRWTGQRSFLVGTPIAGRRHLELEALIGFFVNTLVLHAELEGDPSFEQLVARVRRTALAAYVHQDLPFEQLVEALDPPRDRSRTPLFQVLFALQNLPFEELELPQVRLSALELGSGTAAAGRAKFDLTLTMVGNDEVLEGSLVYSTALFDRTTIDRLAGHLATLLAAAAAAPETTLSALPLLSAGERHQLLGEWNDTRSAATAAAPGDPDILPELFAARARRTPDAVAVVCAGPGFVDPRSEGMRLSFGELERRAGRLASHLIALGVAPESTVGLCLEPSAEMLIALLGIWRAGGAYLPLDPGGPLRRAAFMVRDAGVSVLVTRPGLRERWSDLPLAVVCLAGGEVAAGGAVAGVPAAAGAEAPSAAGPDNLAYVIYTSGSTGRPKGVMVHHRALANRRRGTSDGILAPWAGRQLRVALTSSLMFDASLAQILPLVDGHTLHVFSDEVRRDAHQLLAQLRREPLDLLNFTPSHLRLLVDVGLLAEPALTPSILLVGGEELGEALHRRLAAIPGLSAYNFYGPTENTVDAACSVMRLARDGADLGGPVPNVRIHILDAGGRLVPTGAPGELALAGESLARGYLARPRLTAERFVPDPRGGPGGRTPGERLYRSGDLGRRRADGRLSFLGRIDQQVKVRGFRIELGEIEAALVAHPRVRQAAVIVRRDTAAGKRLVAWLAMDRIAGDRGPEAGDPAALPAADQEELRNHLEARLPAYMVPSALFTLAALPLTPNAKVDRRALAALPEPEAVRAAEEYTAPRTPTEELVAGIWSELLEVERVGVDDDFFALGGHSLLATRVLSRLRRVFDLDLPMVVLFEHPTVAGLAAAVDTASRGDLVPPLVAGAAEREPPLSFAQERFWFLEQLSRGTNTYNVPFALELVGGLRPAALERAFGELTRRHRVLHASFPSRDGRPLQRIARWAPPAIPRLDLRRLAAPRRRGELARLVTADTLRPFDVARGPLLRITLVDLGDQRHGLLLNLHHIIADGWSMGVLIRELVTLYDAFARRRGSPLAPLALDYGDFARWQRGWLRGAALERLLDYWRGELGELPPALALPGQRRPPPGRPPRPVEAGFELPPAVGAALGELCRERGVTLFMAGLAAFAALLARYSGQPRLIIGTPIANRNRIEIEGLVGCFLNTLALAIDLGGDPDFGELLARVRKVCLGAYAHQDLPFEKLVDDYNPDRRSQQPLFQAFFNLSAAEFLELEVEGLEVRPLESRQEGMLGAKFDLGAGVAATETSVGVGLTTNAEVYPPALAERLLDDFRELLTAVVADPELRLSQLPGPDERQRRALAEQGREPAQRPAAPVAAAAEVQDREIAERRSKLEQRLGKLPPALRARIAEHLGKKPSAAPRRPVIPRRGDDGPAPLSLAQERLWFLDRLDPGAATYNVPMVLRLRRALDVGALARSLRAVLRRHQVLRSTFPAAADGNPVQEVGATPARVLPVVDLEAVAAPGEVARALLADDAMRPFDLERGPVARFRLLRIAPRDHLLLLHFHHIVFDAWSSDVLVRELAALYEAEHRGRPSELPELPLQYADFAVWQRRWLAGERLERHLDAWRRQLAGAPAVLALPGDRPSPAAPSFRGRGHRFHLPASRLRPMTAIKERTGATSFMVLMAAFMAWLHRLTGETDLVVGTPVSGRDRRQVEPLIGFFVNILPLRLELDGELTFDQLLARVRHTTLAAYEHQDVPLSKLVEELHPRRAAGHAPLYQVVLMVESAPSQVEMSGSPVAIETLSPPVAKSELTVALGEDADGLGGVIEYNSDRFDATTVARWADQLARLLTASLCQPARRLGELPLLGAAERHLLGCEWNDSAAEVGRPATFHGLYAAQVGRTPEAVAVVAAGDGSGRAEVCLSYGELDRRAERLARRLGALGVGPESRVGLCLEPSPEMIVALLGILKAGGAYLPLDPEHPPERTAFMVRDAGASVVVTSPRLRDRWRRLPLAVVSPETGGAAPVGEPAGRARPLTPAGADNLAYVIYTSGSTGRPKGVMVRHRGLANLRRLFADWVLAGEGGRPLQFALSSSLIFDASLAQLLALLGGHTLHLLTDEVRRDAGLLTRRLRQRPLDVLNFTPSHLRVLVEAGLLGEPRLTPSVLLIGGEPLGDLLHRRLAETPGLTAYNMYGPTESTVDASGSPVRPEGGGAVIGRPVANVRIHILDRRGRRLPIGAIGELAIAGLALARGYLARPRLTAESFVPDPWGAPGGRTPGERLYLSGDLARLRADGQLEFLGRIDHQVKVRGFRVELGEIEAALGAHPSVRQSVAVVRRDGRGEGRLVAYVVCRDPVPAPAAALAAELSVHLRARLPDFMVPAAIVPLDALPLTVQGKVDRRALPAPDSAASAAGTVGPRDELELALVDLWQEVLDRRPIGVGDDFFALGGHSLLAVQLMLRLEQKLGARLPLSALFEGPTVEAQAALLRRSGAHRREVVVGVRPAGSAPPFFCVHPVGGNVLCYVDLARRLGPEQPFYGLQSPDPPAVGETVEEMAASYLEALGRVEPRGPYRLGGWSMGGLVAYEMARRLTAEGREVATLVLIDAAAPRPEARPELPAGGELVALFAADLAALAGAPAAAGEDFATLGTDEALRRLLAAAESLGAVPPGLGLAQVRQLFEVFAANLRAGLRYRPRPWDGRLTLLRTAGAELQDLGWGALAAGGVTVRELPGDHYTMLREPRVAALAAELARCLDQQPEP